MVCAKKATSRNHSAWVPACKYIEISSKKKSWTFKTITQAGETKEDFYSCCCNAFYMLILYAADRYDLEMAAGKGVLQLFSRGVKLVPQNLWKPLKAHILDETFRSRWPQVLKLILPLVLHTIYFLSTFQDLTCFSHFFNEKRHFVMPYLLFAWQVAVSSVLLDK